MSTKNPCSLSEAVSRIEQYQNPFQNYFIRTDKSSPDKIVMEKRCWFLTTWLGRVVRKILGLNETEIKTGAEAVEQALFEIKSPKILHIATHGFFLNDKNLSSSNNKRGSFIPKPLNEAVNIENPLVRSGLALAGANSTLRLSNTERPPRV